jgi:hypothetical protein
MVYWLEMKEERKKPSFDEIIKGLQQKKKMENEDAVAFKESKKQERKEKRDRIRMEALVK